MAWVAAATLLCMCTPLPPWPDDPDGGTADGASPTGGAGTGGQVVAGSGGTGGQAGSDAGAAGGSGGGTAGQAGGGTAGGGTGGGGTAGGGTGGGGTGGGGTGGGGNGCQPNTQTCSVTTLTVCSPGGVPSQQECMFGCKADRSGCRACTEGNTSCMGGGSSTCVGGAWSQPVTCDAGKVCVDGVGCTCAAGTVPLGSTCTTVAGFSDRTNFASPFSGGIILAERIQVPSSRELAALGVYLSKGGPQGRMGLYKDQGGVPSTLVAQSDLSLLAAGRNHLVPTTTVSLQAGAYYWVAIAADASISVLVDTDKQTTIRTLAFGNLSKPLPSDLSSASPSNTSQYQLYVLLR